ncbi:MAG: hypothetical protein J0I99_10270 [Devosia sp.]|uniref:hypothetical protein n=1 Tax=Devosia sp. TaxID=1871048 RepID=UPI001AD4E6D8|nr:hypothetical protein [Devosia sp.]MBN9316114.1 hypothetical protein [Devosia sp.]
MNTKTKLLILALAELAFIAGMQPAMAKPAIGNRPVKIDSTTAKTTCAVMDGTFRYTSGGGWSCKMDTGSGWTIQTCNANGSCTVSREPYRS